MLMLTTVRRIKLQCLLPNHGNSAWSFLRCRYLPLVLGKASRASYRWVLFRYSELLLDLRNAEVGFYRAVSSPC